MDAVNMLSTPPVTRVWIGLILMISSAISLQLVNPSKLLYLPGSTLFLRLFTTFSTWGPIGFTLLIQIMLLKNICGGLERSYQLELGMFPRRVVRLLDERKRALLKKKLERLRALDFAWFMGQLMFSVVVAAHLLRRYLQQFSVPPWMFGYVLDNVLLYISGKTSPEEGITILIIMVKKRYAFWILATINYIFSDEVNKVPSIWSEDGTIASLKYIFKGQLLWCTLLKAIVGHFWWFIRFFLLEDLYNESKTESREAWQTAFEVYETRDPVKEKLQSVVGDFFRFLVIPPWYAVIVPRLVDEA